ncbi:hypothetical protein AMS68_004372 [Peltaster fructicola]|uniref:Uncharacterized protein n=1 Tax=Peltaster fructicola TaxID=286661 RepID=A0A6H0XW20_9PEZI|nr:hypothetical protein AMS68_004372 [Peltaster fructicola]
MDKTVDRVLRTALVYNFLFGIVLLIIFGMKTGYVLLPLGLIPAFFSAVIGLVGLGNGLKKRAVAIPFDSILLAFHIGLFVPGVLSLARADTSSPRGLDAGAIMLGTYATVPLMLDLAIHAYCILRHLPLPGIGATATCPNCQHEHAITEPHFRFAPPSTIFPPSTIYTPDDDDESEAPLNRDYDENTTVRASSEIDDAPPRYNQPPPNAKGSRLL